MAVDRVLRSGVHDRPLLIETNHFGKTPINVATDSGDAALPTKRWFVIVSVN